MARSGHGIRLPISLRVVSKRQLAIAIVSLIALNCAPSWALRGVADAGDTSHLILTQQDVGAHYAHNAPISVKHTLSFVETAAPKPINALIARTWIAGTQTGFNGDRAVRRQAILSTADVFRTTAIDPIARWWMTRYMNLGRGARLTLPSNAPGASRFLLKAHMQNKEVLIYIWRHGTAILQTWVIAPPGATRVPQLLTLARHQDARARAALR
jgi:hypothetical protein